MQNYTSVYDLPHVALIEPIGSPAIAWRITMEDGYWIHLPTFAENQWQYATMVYPDTDYSAIDIRAEADLPEGAEKCGITTPPVVS